MSNKLRLQITERYKRNVFINVVVPEGRLYEFDCILDIYLRNGGNSMEFNTNQINIMLDALEHYGNNPQVDMAIEEMSELTKELLKNRRGKENRSDIAMEMADVYIMLEQLKFIFGIDETELKVNAEFKLQRLNKRLGEVYEQ